MGDSFHFMDRPKVPVHHEFKKSCYVSLQQAWFAWDDKKLDKVLKALREEDGLTQDEALAKMHFDATFFLDCVPRCVLAASKLCWRVRAVHETCGNLIDSETGKPLFNETAWKKANDVVAATLRG